MPAPPLAVAPAPDIAHQTGRHESSARAYHRRIPLRLVAGRGVRLVDSRGDEYLDCLAGAGALALGHGHPVVVEAIQRALRDEVPLTTLDLSTPARDDLIDALFAALPPGLADGCVQFCSPSGADAVEAAVKLARTATGRSGVVAFGGGYHGMTQATMALSGGTAPQAALGPLGGQVHHLPFPADYRCPFGIGGSVGAARCADLLRWTLTDGHSGTAPPAGVLLEPVQGEGGVHPAPAPFARAVQAAAAAAGAAVIVDEVQTGLGRTGALWASEPLGLRPDVMVLSKAIGGGLPLAVIVYRRELDRWEPGAHAGTFRGNQLAFAAGAATIRHVVAEDLPGHAAAMGTRLLDGLRATVAASPPTTRATVGDIRGRGLMVGVELVDPDRVDHHGVPVPDGEAATRLQQALLHRGVIAEIGGRAGAVLRFLPPLIIGPGDIDQVVDAFAAALRATGPGR